MNEKVIEIIEENQRLREEARKLRKENAELIEKVRELLAGILGPII